MATGATIATIKAGLIARYQAISLPGGLGTPTAIGRELDGSPPTFPYIEIYTNPTQRMSQNRGEDGYEITRRFFARLYVAAQPSDTPSIKDADYVKAENCIEPIEDYFYFTDDRLSVAFVTANQIVADTAPTVLPTRDNRLFVGVAFEHLITYIRQR